MATTDLTNAIGANTDTTDPFARLPNESFYQYLQRIKNIRGMLLGQYEQPTVDEAVAEELTQQPLGKEIVRDSDGDGPQDNGPTGPNKFGIERAIGLLSDKAKPGVEAGAMVAGLPGALIGGLVDYGSKSALDSALEEAGLTPEQIDAVKANPNMLEGMMARGDFGFTQKGGYQQGFLDKAPSVLEVLGITKPTQNYVTNTGYITTGLGGRVSPTTQIGVNPYAPQINAQFPAYQGLPQGMITGGNQYVDSYGNVRDTSGMTNQTMAGLQAVTSGMFDTPSWYQDEYTEPSSSGGSDGGWSPSTQQDTSSWSSDDFDSNDSGYDSGGWSGSYDAGWT